MAINGIKEAVPVILTGANRPASGAVICTPPGVAGATQTIQTGVGAKISACWWMPGDNMWNLPKYGAIWVRPGPNNGEVLLDAVAQPEADTISIRIYVAW